MAQLAIAGAGAILGGALGSAVGYASLGASIGWALGGLAGNMLFGPKPPPVEGPRLGDLTVQTSTYGVAIPIVYGTARIAGNIIWAKPIREQVVRRRIRAGKGGGRRQTVTEYQYFGYWASAFCEGPIQQVLRIWFDSHLVYDATGTSSNTKIPGLRFRLYKGTEDQLPDPLIEQDVGAANAVAFRGLCYIVFEDVPLSAVGNRIPSVSIEVTSQAQTSVIVQNTGSVVINNYPQAVAQDCVAHDPENKKSYMLLGAGALSGSAGLEIVDWETVRRWRIALEVGSRCTGIAARDNYVAVTGLPSGFSDRGPVLCFSATTGELLGSYGFNPNITTLSSSFSGIAAGTNSDPSIIVRVSSLNGFEYYYVRVPFFNNIWISKLPSGPYVTGTGISSQNHFNAITPTGFYMENSLCLGEERPGSSVFYHAFCYNNTATSPINLHVYTISAGAYGTLFNTLNVSVKKFSFSLLQTGAPSSSFSVSQAGMSFKSSYYDAVNNCAVFCYTGSFTSGSGDVLFAVNENGQIVWARNLPIDTLMPNGSSRSGHYCALITGSQEVLFKNDGLPLPHTFTILDFRDGKTVFTGTSNLTTIGESATVPYSTHYPDENAFCYRGDPILQNGNWFKVRYPFFTGQGVSLFSIVSDLCSRAGLSASQINVAALTDSVQGFVLSKQSSVRSALEPLAIAYDFDAVERDGVLVFRKRGGSVVQTIPLEDYIREEGQPLIEELRAQDADLYKTIYVRHIDKDRTYEIGTQYWARPISPESVMFSVGQTTIDLPIVMTAEQAKNIAKRVMLASWQERVRYKFSLPLKYIRLEPTDPINITRPDGSIQRARIISSQFRGDWVVEIEAVEEPGTIFPLVQADTGQGTSAPIIMTPGLCIPFAPQLPLMRAQDDTGGTGLLFYAAASTEANKLYLSVTLNKWNGSSFESLGILPEDAAWGDIIGSVPVPQSYWTWDRQTVIEVLVSRGISRFVTEPELNVLNGANKAIIFSEQNVEVIQFQEVVPVSANRIQLRNLLRGRFGTEDAGGFSSGARLVLFDDSFRSFVASVSDLNKSRRLRFPRQTEDVSFAKEITYIVNGRAEQPWAPVHIRGTRNNANDVTITWVRRTRFNGELLDFTGEVPLNEESELYDVEIRNPADTATVRSFLNLSSPTVTYTASQQTADGLTPGDPVRVRVWQRSALVGRGRMGSAIV